MQCCTSRRKEYVAHITPPFAANHVRLRLDFERKVTLLIETVNFVYTIGSTKRKLSGFSWGYTEDLPRTRFFKRVGKAKARDTITYLRSFDFSHEFLLLTFHEFLQLLHLLPELALQFFETLGLLGFNHCSFVFRGGQIGFDTFQLLLVLKANKVNK